MYVFESRKAPSGGGKENRIWTAELLRVQILTLESFERSRGRAIKYIMKGLREGSLWAMYSECSLTSIIN